MFLCSTGRSVTACYNIKDLPVEQDSESRPNRSLSVLSMTVNIEFLALYVRTCRCMSAIDGSMDGHAT